MSIIVSIYFEVYHTFEHYLTECNRSRLVASSPNTPQFFFHFTNIWFTMVHVIFLQSAIRHSILPYPKKKKKVSFKWCSPTADDAMLLNTYLLTANKWIIPYATFLCSLKCRIPLANLVREFPLIFFYVSSIFILFYLILLARIAYFPKQITFNPSGVRFFSNKAKSFKFCNTIIFVSKQWGKPQHF